MKRVTTSRLSDTWCGVSKEVFVKLMAGNV